jgi:DNA modification methylase
MEGFIGGNVVWEGSLDKVVEEIPSSTFDLVILRPDFSNCPVKETKYSSWLFDLSKKIMRCLKSTGSLVVIMKEGVDKGKRKSFALDYLMKMSDNEYWTETFIWHKTNPHPTGNKKRLKDGFEHCYQFNRSKDYKFFPDQCLIKAKNEWEMGEDSSFLTRQSNLVSFPSKKNELPIGLCEFFINLMTERGDLVFVPFLGEGNEVTSCLNVEREYFGVCSSQKSHDRVEKRISEWKSENIYSGQSIFG